MIETSQLISDVQGEFEGGNSLSVDWDTKIRLAVENVLDNCRPETLKRKVALYGGLSQNLNAYYCPPDVLVPSDIFTNDGLRKFTYTSPRNFYTKGEQNKYTIEYINGKRFVVIRHDVTSSILEIEAMDSVGTKSGGTPALNDHNFLFGSGAVEATFTDAGIEFGATLATAIDVSDYLRGIVLLPVYIEDAANLTSLQLRLKTDNSNYHKVISTADSIGDYFVDGWNFVRFNMANRTEFGTPVDTNITAWSIIPITATGTTQKLIFDKLTIQKYAPYYFQYYSSRPYIDGDTGALWKETVEKDNDDKINFDRDLAGVLHYELCLQVLTATNFQSVDAAIGQTFSAQLKRKWENYWAIHPSDEAPVTYSKSPEIGLDQDSEFGELSQGTESFIE